MQDFNPHLPRGRWLIRWVWTAYQSDFNPHLPRGRWHTWDSFIIRIHDFNPHLPRGRWHRMSQAEFEKLIFQSTPSSRKVTTAKRPADHKDRISIHTFLAEGDINGRYYISIHLNFNPHLPRGRWRLCARSTGQNGYFNPHLPRGRWQFNVAEGAVRADFNPHLPRGRWLWQVTSCIRPRYFNPHLPRGRWLSPADQCSISGIISIHTFLAEGDKTCFICGRHLAIFQSTPSSRKVTFHRTVWKERYAFQSTPSSRKVTMMYSVMTSCRQISIHTFLAEGDAWVCIHQVSTWYFNPHLPRGRWRNLFVNTIKATLFQSTPSSRKVTRLPEVLLPFRLFQSTPSSRKVTLSL